MEGVSSNSYIDDMKWKKEDDARYADPDERSKLEQEDFFRLLTEQLSMQDPSKPVENDQMIAQMTNFTMAEGITGLSERFDQFASDMTSNQALQASTMVGRKVLVPTDQANLETGAGVTGMIATPQSAQNVKINIKDSTGATVKTIEIGDMPQGTKEFEWDGKMANGDEAPAGNYSFSVNAQVGGKTEELPIQMHARVQSVSTGGDRGVVLNLKGLGGIKLSDVTEIS
ncbi:flagellar hook assembly protein FlgD [Idiomarina loihiensis]|uniref:Basal-body rod modification protein FlgD n=1 Tax=Idiomarina loihiensis (strain ATCC BAA-735 / DSM 15497 / L2-TR) TaxID=283942 RepID=Q5R0P5_IDILO|nr:MULTISPECIES: flagellar hook assembly protein FlgD [Idiomarina]AAV81985.1 Flagellar hook capping protein [Idiomarina loihiensis L2TR]AGM36015.1 flagellar basal body rod modification protein [Idiomarina loihiensis GSL 199]TDO53020.1 flagellar basal-body rod modification protein FlgD [Idiomarina sp. 017G]|tara:strand:- start:144 stop:827 length:684 start_codon:yes stop_codon:yes gene_type:complete